MWRCLVAIIASCASVAHAQNWALLNPAYRYNYSNDGTDTISNQIRVMDVDTLGVDSFRYELNLIGAVCDTCSAIYEWQCDGCFVMEDQPQFLGYDCVRTGNNWIFSGIDTVLIQSNADVGASWMFNETVAISATVDAEWASALFGLPDTLQRILLSNGDSLLLSHSLGLVHFGRGSEHYDLIGLEGADVGICFPDPLDYFDFQVGDELTYKVVSRYWVQPPGGPQYPQSRSHHWMVRVTGRNETDSSRHYTTSIAQTFDDWPDFGSLSHIPDWPIPNNLWSFDRASILLDHPILGAYPNQFLERTMCWNQGLGYLVGSGITSGGSVELRAQLLGSAFSAPATAVDMYEIMPPGIHPFLAGSMVDIEVWYQQGIGLREVKRRYSSADEVSVELVGAIIAGDTVIQPPMINWTVGMNDLAPSAFSLFPNPASDHITLAGATGNETITIRDLGGRLVRTARMTSAQERIPVSDIAPGLYLITVDAMLPQRLVIAR